MDLFFSSGGSTGSSNGQFDQPDGVVVDSTGVVYVGDNGNGRYQRFNEEGVFLSSCDPFSFLFPPPPCCYLFACLAVDSNGRVFIADNGTHQVHRISDAFCATETSWGSQGSAAGQFSNPMGIGVNASGHVFVVDTDNNRIQVFTDDGAFIQTWGSFGTGPGQFDMPWGLAVGPDGHIYVSDSGNHRVQEFLPNGDFVMSWGTQGIGPGQFDHPSGIAVDSNGNVYVADEGLNRVLKFAP